MEIPKINYSKTLNSMGFEGIVMAIVWTVVGGIIASQLFTPVFILLGDIIYYLVLILFGVFVGIPVAIAVANLIYRLMCDIYRKVVGLCVSTTGRWGQKQDNEENSDLPVVYEK